LRIEHLTSAEIAEAMNAVTDLVVEYATAHGA
jgi:hypothetical protein